MNLRTRDRYTYRSALVLAAIAAALLSFLYISYEHFSRWHASNIQSDPPPSYDFVQREMGDLAIRVTGLLSKAEQAYLKKEAQAFTSAPQSPSGNSRPLSLPLESSSSAAAVTSTKIEDGVGPRKRPLGLTALSIS